MTIGLLCTTCRFNTQPRGGGCLKPKNQNKILLLFQHTAARRRLQLLYYNKQQLDNVSTHSRAEAAAFTIKSPRCRKNCFNTQPRGGGCIVDSILLKISQCFNTQPRGGGCGRRSRLYTLDKKFQHTAARRRLPFFCVLEISTSPCFNTQPPEGGCRQ